MTSTAHTSAVSALATKAQRFVLVAGVLHAFADEDACWRFHQSENIIVGSYESSGRPVYFTRREVAA